MGGTVAVQLRQIAPEHYDTLSHHTSWTWVTWKFLTDPEVGPWTRMRRLTKGHDDSAPADPKSAGVGEAGSIASEAKAAGLDADDGDLGYGIPLGEVRDSGLRSRAAAAGLLS